MIFAILLNEIRLKLAKSLVQTFHYYRFLSRGLSLTLFFQTFFSANRGLVNVLLVDLGLIPEGLTCWGSSIFRSIDGYCKFMEIIRI